MKEESIFRLVTHLDNVANICVTYLGFSVSYFFLFCCKAPNLAVHHVDNGKKNTAQITTCLLFPALVYTDLIERQLKVLD